MRLEKGDLKELVTMKDLTVRQFIVKVKRHPRLNFLLTTAGVWLLVRMAFFVLITANVIYALTRIFSLVTG